MKLEQTKEITAMAFRWLLATLSGTCGGYKAQVAHKNKAISVSRGLLQMNTRILTAKLAVREVITNEVY